MQLRDSHMTLDKQSQTSNSQSYHRRSNSTLCPSGGQGCDTINHAVSM